MEKPKKKTKLGNKSKKDVLDGIAAIDARIVQLQSQIVDYESLKQEYIAEANQKT